MITKLVVTEPQVMTVSGSLLPGIEKTQKPIYI